MKCLSTKSITSTYKTILNITDLENLINSSFNYEPPVDLINTSISHFSCHDCTSTPLFKSLNIYSDFEIRYYCEESGKNYNNSINEYLKKERKSDKNEISNSKPLYDSRLEPKIKEILDKLEEIKKMKEKFSAIQYFLSRILISYFYHPEIKNNRENIKNIAESLEKQTVNPRAAIKEEMVKLQNGFNNMHDTILGVLNFKLKGKIKEEIKSNIESINLSNQGITNEDLLLLSLIKFDNLKELDLSENEINNIEYLKFSVLPKIKKINLSHNKIKELPNTDNFNLKDQMPELQGIYINGNEIEKNVIDPIKNDCLYTMKEFESEIMRSSEKSDNYPKGNKMLMIYRYNREKYEETRNFNGFRMFGPKFVEKNREKCTIYINDGPEESLHEICEFNELNKRSPKKINIDDNWEVKVVIREISTVESFSYMFDGCSNLLEVPNSIQGESFSWDTKKVKNMAAMFRGCKYLVNVSVCEKFDTKIVTSFYNMFNGCNSLSSVPFKNLKTDECEDMSFMFYQCSRLKEVGFINNLNTKKVRFMKATFSGCTDLKNLPEEIGRWNTENLEEINSMFNGCRSLERMPDISGWNIRKMKKEGSIASMFKGCSSLREVPTIVNWKLLSRVNKNGVFSNCDNIIRRLPEGWD